MVGGVVVQLVLQLVAPAASLSCYSCYNCLIYEEASQAKTCQPQETRCIVSRLDKQLSSNKLFNLYQLDTKCIESRLDKQLYSNTFLNTL